MALIGPLFGYRWLGQDGLHPFVADGKAADSEGFGARASSELAHRADALIVLPKGQSGVGGVADEASDRPTYFTFPAFTRSDMAPTVSSMGVCGSTRCW